MYRPLSGADQIYLTLISFMSSLAIKPAFKS
jgi:hypothetical protein